MNTNYKGLCTLEYFSPHVLIIRVEVDVLFDVASRLISKWEEEEMEGEENSRMWPEIQEQPLFVTHFPESCWSDGLSKTQRQICHLLKIYSFIVVWVEVWLGPQLSLRSSIW